MTLLRDFLTHDHRQCDDHLASAEQAVAHGDLSAVAREFAAFVQSMLLHFEREETLLFPAFEQKTGMSMGPTQVMRHEHMQMRALFSAAQTALQAGDTDEYLGQVETLLIMMQQHNMKEENVLYPMCDQHLTAEAPALLVQLKEKQAIA